LHISTHEPSSSRKALSPSLQDLHGLIIILTINYLTSQKLAKIFTKSLLPKMSLLNKRGS
jgi:hypothetical protein